MQYLDRLWTSFDKSLFVAGAMVLVMIVLATVWDVVARSTALHAPIWLSTFVEFALPLSTMMAAPYLVRARGHVAMELIDAALGDPARRSLIRLTDLAAGLVCLLIAYYAALGGLDAFNRREMLVLAIDVPRWILFSVLTIGFALCTVEFLRHLVISLGGGASEAEEL